MQAQPNTIPNIFIQSCLTSINKIINVKISNTDHVQTSVFHYRIKIGSNGNVKFLYLTIHSLVQAVALSSFFLGHLQQNRLSMLAQVCICKFLYPKVTQKKSLHSNKVTCYILTCYFRINLLFSVASVILCAILNNRIHYSFHMKCEKLLISIHSLFI